MDSKEYLSRIHSEILTVMDEVVRVCKKNNLRYYLIGGTLLGAVRHGGFIPWDDDLDIAMPRDDFETFIKIAPQELRYPFELQWTTTNKEYWLQFAKVCNTNTLFDERSYHKCNRSFGVFVDIFALDRTVGFSEELVCRKNKIVRLMTMMRTRLGITENPRKIDRILNVVAAPLSIRFMHNVMTRDRKSVV